MMPDSQKEKISTTVPRRGFLGWTWTLLAGIAVIEVFGVALSFFFPRPGSVKKETARNLLTAGPVDAFAPGSVTPFPRGRFYLVRMETGGFLALCATCTHLGCSLPWDEEKKAFICPCHASRFDLKGEVVSPPAQRAMDLFKISIKNQTVYVDIAKKIRRDRFEKNQVTIPETIDSPNETS